MNNYIIKQGYNGLIAKVKVLDTRSRLCFEAPIYPEEITTTRYGSGTETTMSFSPITVPELGYWRDFWHGRRESLDPPTVNKIIFSGPCTIILWKDGTKTIAKVSEGDEFDPEKGVAVCFMKKILGHTEANKLLRKAHEAYDLYLQYADDMLKECQEVKNA